MELARQLTILESRLFHSIHPMDYLFYRADDQTTAEPIRRMIRHANRITGWVGEMILRERDDPRRRADIIKFFVKLAEKCHVLNNFATREAILSALNATPIYRLKHTWAQVTPKTKASFDSLMRFMDRDRNFQTYRTALRTASPPCIPFIGLFLTDVNFIAQGNADRVGEDARLVNFDKYQKMAVVVGEIRRFQESSHNFVILDEVQEFLARQLRKSRDVQQLHGLSLEVESRVTGTEPSPAVTPTMPKASAIEEKTTIGSVSVPTAASVDISK